MENIRKLLKKLKDQEIDVTLVGDNIELHYDLEELSAEHLDEIRANKTMIIQFLKELQLRVKEYAHIPELEFQPSYALSSSQRSLWVMSRLDENSTAYNISDVFEFEGDLDVPAFEASLKTIIQRHEILRTVFKEEKEHGVRQYIVPAEEYNFKLEYTDLTGAGTAKGKAKNIFATEMQFHFNLAAGPLLRCALLKTGENNYLFCCVMHHIISDGWSMEVIIRELSVLYPAFKRGDKDPLPPLRIQYKDYAAWQQQQLSGAGLLKYKEYWLGQFQGELPVIELPGDKMRPGVKTYNGGILYKSLDANTCNGIKELSQELGGTLFMGLLATLNVLLYRYTAQTDIIIGSPVAGREHPDLEDQIGYYVNTLALRNRFSGEDSFSGLFEKVKKVTLDAYEHQAYPFDELVAGIGSKRDTSRNALFDVMMALQNTNSLNRQEGALGDISVKVHNDTESVISKFDLTVVFVELPDGRLEMSLEYNSDIYNPGTIERLGNHYSILLKAVIKNREVPVCRLAYLSEAEKEQLREFNRVDPVFSLEKSIVELIEKNVNDFPDKVAVSWNERQITYRGLTQNSDKIALRLRSGGLKKEDVVVMLADRSIDFITGVLAIWKAGGTYLPLQADYPDDRIRTILKRSRARYVMCSQDAFEKKKNALYDTEVIQIDIAGGEQACLQQANNIVLYNTLVANTTGTAVTFSGPENKFRELAAHAERGATVTVCISDLSDRTLVMAAMDQYGKRISVLPSSVIKQEDELIAQLNMLKADLLIADHSFVDLAALIKNNTGVKKMILLPENVKADEKVEDWKSIWDFTAENTTYALSDYGWSSSYDSMPFSDEEINEYIANFSEKLHAIIQADFAVLEIGTGHGLVCREIAPKVKSYIATDLSPVIIQKNKRWAEELGFSNVVFECAGADEIAALDCGPVDVVVCSSVTHYFPNTFYFEKVIEAALSRLKDTGYIYMDDLLDYAKKNAFREDLISYKRSHPGSKTSLSLDNNLFISASFIEYLKERFPEIREAVVSKKTGKIPNELTKYRFDLLLQIDKKNAGRNKAGSFAMLFDRFEGAADLASVGLVHTQSKDENIVLAPVDPDSLAYVIYTSGSTGEPKGVMIEHKGMLNHIGSKITDLGMDCESIVAQNASQTFDISVWQFFSALVTGGTTIIYDKEVVLEPADFMERLDKDKVSVLELVPSYFVEMLDTLEQQKGRLKFKNLKSLVLNAETLMHSMVKRWLALFPGIPVINTYGITEVSDDISHYPMLAVPDTMTVPVLKKPIQHFEVYIVDDLLQFVPIGVKGEILVCGPFVGRGYLFDEERTRKVFLDGPLEGITESRRIYRTGDLARYLPDGTMEFLGRKDTQVKIRGNRIELGEIEHALTGYAGLKNAKVIVNGQSLIAYYQAEQELDNESIISIIRERLPEYMIPQFFVYLEKFPLTPNGKIDKKALPLPGAQKDGARLEYTRPSNSSEKILADVWENIFERGNISINDNFYELGGDSIKAIQVVSRVNQKGYLIKVADVFNNPVLSNLAKLLQKKSREIDQYLVIGELLLTPVQEEFLAERSGTKSHYNQSVMLDVKGEINEEGIKKCFEQLVIHHDILRANYIKEEGRWKQLIREDKSPLFLFESIDLGKAADGSESIQKAGDAAQAGFDLEKGALVNVKLIRMQQGSKLLIIIHHLLVDGISWRILLEDLATLYTQYAAAQPLRLPLKTDSFRNWSHKLNEYAGSAALLKEKKYWQKIAQTQVPALKPDHPGAANRHGDEQVISFRINPELTSLLLTKANIPYNTGINDVLLTALGTAVKNSFGITTFITGLEAHGREEIIPDMDITRTVGWFTSFYPVIIDVSGDDDKTEKLIRVKEELRNVPQKGIGYGLLKYTGKVLKDEIPYSFIFNYLGDFGSGIKNQGAEEMIFTYSEESTGREISDNHNRKALFEISVLKANEELMVSVSYSEKQFEHSTVAALTQAYEQELKELVYELSGITGSRLTASDLTFRGLKQEELNAINAENNVEDIYGLSPLQQGIFYHWMADPSPMLYFEQFSYELAGQFDAAALQKAYDLLVDRHPVLRTYFVNEYAAEPLQVVNKAMSCKIQYLDLGNIKEGDKNKRVVDFKRNDREQGFNLETGSQMRLSVLYKGHNVYEFVWSFHHILMDGWCVSILINDFFRLYASVLSVRPIELEPVIPYANYLKWLDKNDDNASLAYWKEYLAGYSQKAAIPFLKKNNSGAVYKHASGLIAIAGEKFAGLKKICRELDITENMFIQSAWGYLLSKYNGTGDVVFGAVVSGRPPELEGVEDIVGLFSNTIPVRFKTGSAPTARKILEAHKLSTVASMPHHYLNLSLVQAQSDLGKELIDHIIIFENFLAKETDLSRFGEQQPDFEKEVKFLSSEVHEQTNYNFNIVVLPNNDRLTIDLRYNSNYYEAAQIDLLTGHLTRVIEQFIFNADQQLSEWEYISEEEKKVLLGFNAEEEIVSDRTIVELLEEQVKNAPDKIAVKFNDAAFSYAETGEISTQLAHYLQERYKINSGDLAGIKLPRNEWMVFAVLGLLKSGAAYVPVDPEYPEERISYIMDDSGCKFIIDDLILEDFRNTLKKDLLMPACCTVKPSDLAYVIYTSGSTGKPKGVMVEHRNVTAFIAGMEKNFGMEETFRVAFSTNLSFDISVLELLGTLCLGKTLVVFDERELSSPALFSEKLQKEEVDVLQLTPSRLSQLKEQFDGASRSLKVLLIGGEAMSQKQYEELKQKEHLKVVNVYGPTETTIWSSALHIGSSMCLSIGKPLLYEQLYIMDEASHLSPAGITGEICIGGKGVARGYLNRKELTEEKFVSSPFKKGERIYKTGDLGRWLADGTIEYLGRKDSQVKVRGYRIELEEIENTLLRYPSVIKAAAAIKKNAAGQEEIVAYITSENPVKAIELLEFSGKFLPWYMLPSHFKSIPEFPLTASGKINRAALHTIYSEEIALGNEYVPPSNAIQEKLVEIWEEVLGREKIGITDNFFLLGGHSLNVMQLIAKINRSFSCKLSIERIFEAPDILNVAAEIARLKVIADVEDREATDEHVKITI